MRSAIGQARALLVAVLAGALGGALLGLSESALVTWTSAAADEYWLFLFGAAVYGLIGAALGFAAALAWQLLRRGRAADVELASVAVSAALALPVFAVGRYHVAQRIFEEQLPIFTPQGVLVHALLLVGAVAAVVLGALVVRGCLRVGGLPLLAGALVAVLALGGAIGVATDHTAAPAVAPRPRSPAAGKPNIILIVTDTLRADAAEWVRQQKGSTGFAQLAADGVVFDRTYSQASWTRPSIATILTAEYPSDHGTVHKMDFLPDNALTLAEVLKGQGYWTAAFTTNINVAPIFNFQQGFDEFHYLEPSFYFGATDSATKLAVYKGLRVAREKVSNKMWVENFYQDAAVVDRHVEAWLERRPPEPFFLFIHYMDPHDPYFEIPYDGNGVARVSTPDPAPARADELRTLYREDVRYLDGYLQKLVDRLKQSGIYDRSIVAITADHGEEFYDHGGWWHGTALYDEQVHVPLIIKRAREPEPGRHRTDIARSVDIGPSLLASAQLAIPERFRGIDLFTGTVSEPVLAEEDLEGNRLTSIRSGDWKLITANHDNPRGLPPTELFNLADDAQERTNLAGREGDRVSDMLAQLEQLRARLAAGKTRAGTIGTADTHAADPRS
jgi:arylsulfatase A-like enzyme